MRVLWISLYLILLSSVCCGEGEDDCMYKYTQQPPNELDCNPYPNEELRLRCTVEGPWTGDFSIKWWSRTLGDVVNELEGMDQTMTSPGNGAQIMQSMLRINLPTAVSGQYWCQVVVTDGEELMASNEFNLYPSEAYDGYQICAVNSNGVPLHTYVESDKCADLIDTEPTTPVPEPSSPSPSPSSTSELNSSTPDPTSTTEGPISAMLNKPVSITITTAPAVSHPLTGTPTGSPTDTQSKSLEASLYAVIAVVLVFCAIIIALAIGVVILCRRKCNRFSLNSKAQTTSTNEYSNTEDTQPPPYPEDTPNNASPPPKAVLPLPNPTNLPPPLPPPLPSSDASYSRLRSFDTPVIYPVPEGYSKLGEWETSQGNHAHLSLIYSDMEDPSTLHQAPPHIPPHPPNIYRTLEDPTAEDKSSTQQSSEHYYHVLEERRGDTSGSNETSSGERWPVKAKPLPPRRAGATQRTLFDDPEYSSVKPREGKFEISDPRYRGDYERHPDYITPRMELPTSEVDPKYLGDYERHPDYVPKPPPRKMSPELPPQPPQRRQSLDHDPRNKYSGDYERDPLYVPPYLRGKGEAKSRLHKSNEKYVGDYERDPNYVPPHLRDNLKYSGDYERDPNYVLPHLRRVANGEPRRVGAPELDPKYLGDYERDPQYMANRFRKSSLQDISTLGTSAEYHYAYANPTTFGSTDLIPPHFPHEYKALEEALKDPPRHYTKLHPDQESGLLSLSNQV